MTPKEKAMQILSRYYLINEKCGGHITLGMGKQCALICVDEIINSNPMTEDSEDTGRGIRYWHSSDVSYWQEVKQEINKL